MQPFFEGRGVAVYCAPWQAVWQSLGLSPSDVALVWADPPYGVGERTDRKKKGRGRNRMHGERCARGDFSRDWPPVAGDDQPFQPAELLDVGFPRLVMWGANHYASRLPDSPTWWTWDKRVGTARDSNADCELAWTNLGGPARLFPHLWRGFCQASEKGRGARRIHPTQKPVALCRWGFQQARIERGALVFVPYMGSGPELAAAVELGLRVIACELVEAYCAAAVSYRLGVESAAAPAFLAGAPPGAASSWHPQPGHVVTLAMVSTPPRAPGRPSKARAIRPRPT